MSDATPDPLLPDLEDVPKNDGPSSDGDADQVPDTPVTDPERRESAQPTGEEQAEHNRRTENPT
jgi:hypothetical protein